MTLSKSISRLWRACVTLGLVLCVAGCDDGGDSPAMDTALDQQVDTAPADTGQADDTAIADTAEPDTTVAQDTREERELSPIQGPCTVDADCERGLGCIEDTCYSIVGCDSRTEEPPDHGCIIERRTGGLHTAIECFTDADCVGSPYGSSCIWKVCTDQTACDTDSDCQAPETCYNEILCLPE